MSKNDGGPAFPCPADEMAQQQAIGSRLFPSDFTGMSLRDYFAAAALPAVIAAYVAAQGECLGSDHILTNVACISFKFSDAMLAERSK